MKRVRIVHKSGEIVLGLGGWVWSKKCAIQMGFQMQRIDDIQTGVVGRLLTWLHQPARA